MMDLYDRLTNKRFISVLTTAILYSWLLLKLSTLSAQVVINEFQASNNRVVPEMYDFSDFPDWIELYNGSDQAIDMSGFSLSDDLNEPKKWVFPHGFTIPPNGFALLWADGENQVPGIVLDRPWLYATPFTTKYFHLSFKLNKEGEEIILYNAKEEIIDYIEFPPQLENVSFGRKPDGGPDWYFFGDPSPEASNEFTAYTTYEKSKALVIHPASGFITEEIEISIEPEATESVIRYELNGTVPTEKSPVFFPGLSINSKTILSARSWEPGKLPSDPVYASYLFDNKAIDLPIISISCDPKFLWDQEKGIYSNNLKQRDIPVLFEYFISKENRVLSQYASIKLSGQAAWQYPQKPFTLEANTDFGEEYLTFPFFSHVFNGKYRSIYLRNSGTPDTYYTMFRDALCHSIVKNEMDIDLQDYQPAILYLNGDFWGIYNIREKLDKHYFTNHHQADPNQLNILEYNRSPDIIIDEGSADEYYDLIEFIEHNNLSLQENFEYISSKIDIDEYINYMITQLYIDNTNWVELNVKWWKENKENKKWRWILSDTDISYGEFGSYSNHGLYRQLLNHEYYPEWSLLLFRSLHQNESFRNEFIQRFAACNNTLFNENRVVNLIDSLQETIISMMPHHINRWKDGFYLYGKNPIQNMEEWGGYVESMREFARERVEFLRTEIQQLNNIQSTFNLTLNKEGGKGKIYLNDIRIPEKYKTGKYYGSIPFRLKAVPEPGYEFVEWKNVSHQNEIITQISENTSLVAVFKESDACEIPADISVNLTLNNTCPNYYSKGDILVREGVTLQLEEGIQIEMAENAKIEVHGQLKILGTEQLPVVIQSFKEMGSKKWGGICIKNSPDTSFIKHLALKNASRADLFTCKGAISSLNSNLILENVNIKDVEIPVYIEYGSAKISHCYFSSPFSIDLVNIKYADFALIDNCTFEGNKTEDSDAIDLDGVFQGTVSNNRISCFSGFNSDAIDLGENCENVLVHGNRIYNIKDKGISVGQGSKCTIERNLIVTCGQGIGIKDKGSYAVVNQNTFYGNDFGVACFEKNISAGGGSADIVNCIFSKNNSSAIFTDQHSETNINYSLSDTESLSGTGNIMASPNFKDEYGLNFELDITSPCIDGGDPESPKDPDLSNADMGAYYFHITDPEISTEVVINEIHYHPSDDEFNSGEWIELYNKGNETIDLSNWVLMDGQNNFYQVDKGILLEPDRYLVISNDIKSLKSCYPGNMRILEDFDFGLNNQKDHVRLFDNKQNLIDIVTYEDRGEWPETADGEGPSLMLKDVFSDNNDPENWCGKSYPTPGINNYDIKAAFKSIQMEPCSKRYLFKNTSSGIIDSVSWQFDENSYSQEYEPQFVFDNFEFNPVELQIFNATDEDLVSINVQADMYLEKPDVVGSYHCGPGQMNLHAYGEYDIHWFEHESDQTALAYGNTYFTQHLDSTMIFYAVDYLNESCKSQKVKVLAEIVPLINADFNFFAQNSEMVFYSTSDHASYYHWDFGDGESKYVDHFVTTHQYKTDGTYLVTLTCWDSEKKRCFNVIQKEVVVNNVSTQEPGHDEIMVFPNPGNNITRVVIPEHLLPIKLDLYDLYGNSYLEDLIIDTPLFELALPPTAGIYLISVFNKSHKFHKTLRLIRL